MLQNGSLLAIVAVDTEENEPSKVLDFFLISISPSDLIFLWYSHPRSQITARDPKSIANLSGLVLFCIDISHSCCSAAVAAPAAAAARRRRITESVATKMTVPEENEKIREK